MLKKYLIIDRDGTLIREPEDDFQVDSLEKLSFLPNAISTLKRLQNLFELVMVTNQDGLGTDSFPTEDFEKPHQKMIDILADEGVTFNAILICPHKPEDTCECRKPKPKLVIDYLFSINETMDKENSYVFGDRDSDKELAKNLGIHFVSFDQSQRTSWIEAEKAVTESRRANVSRKTKETDISIALDLNGSGQNDIDTGLPFFDHMLDQIGRFSNIDLTIKANGDLDIDAHHLVEDVAILLGQAIHQALGNKFGIERYAFVLPMDEAECQISMDFSGRFVFDFKGTFNREIIGDFPTEMVKHFFYSLCEHLKITCLMSIQGENDHHKIESAFKAFGKCLATAISVTSNQLMSTKGLL